MRLEGKKAIVTGAGSGFGEGIARQYAAEGAKVLIADINKDAAERVAQDIGKNARVFVGDVGDNADVAAMIGAAVDGLGGLDILVNNAGIPQRNCWLLDVDEATFDNIMRVNVKSVYLSVIHAVPVMQKAGGGVIINTSSTAAIRPRPGLTWYNSSKGAVQLMTKSLAVELAPDNIRVNALCPVVADTGMIAEFMGGEDTQEMREKFVATVPLGRMCTPKDMGYAALYLASSEADFITGVCLEVDGGRCV